MKSFVATSTAAAAADAGKEAAAKIAAGIEGAKFAFAYGSADYDTPELLAAIAAGLVVSRGSSSLYLAVIKARMRL